MLQIVSLRALGSSSYGGIFTSLNSQLRLAPTLIGQSILFCSLSLRRKTQPQKLLHCRCAIMWVCVCVCVSRAKCRDITHCRVQGTHKKKTGTQTLYFNTTWRIKQSNISRNTPHIIAHIDKRQTLTRSNALCMHVRELRECTQRPFSLHKKADHTNTHACMHTHTGSLHHFLGQVFRISPSI